MVLAKLNSIFEKISKNLNLSSSLSFVSSNRPDLADFQSNDAMKLAKELKSNPKDIANQIVNELKQYTEFSDVSVAGPGFINVKLSDDFIIKSLNESFNNYIPVISKAVSPLVIDLDYGAYNVAKSLHIGHLRTTIVGDTVNRISKALGHKTISYNHIGDFGRPMGIVIAYIKKLHPDWPYFQPDFNPNSNTDDLIINPKELEDFYPKGSAFAKENPEFMEEARNITTELQNGNIAYNALYEKFLKISLLDMENILKTLGVLDFDSWAGERNARKYLNNVADILNEKKLLRKDDGAMIVDVATESDTAPMPPLMFINSHDGGTYAAADLSAIYYRVNHDNPDFIWYFTDSRQALHFNQVFRVADKMGLIPMTKLKHCPFGTITGPNGKPFATRDGNVPRLQDIIQMVVEAVQDRVNEANKKLKADDIHKIAISALKFNDLMHEVKSDYVFDLNLLTSFEGKTGPYILYTSVRLNSILNKIDNLSISKNIDYSNIQISVYERDLMLALLDFDRILHRSFDNISPDILANYLYELAVKINLFYHNCPVLRNDIPSNIVNFRIDLIRKSKSVLDIAINLLGMEIPSEM